VNICKKYLDTLPIGRQVASYFHQFAAGILVKDGEWFFGNGIIARPEFKLIIRTIIFIDFDNHRIITVIQKDTFDEVYPVPYGTGFVSRGEIIM